MNGVVSAFDEHIGLGDVLGEDGSTYPFHCTQIADGTRKIDTGTSVTFVVKQRHKGLEAYEIVKT